MQADDGSVREVYVQPGELHLLREPAILRTVLGSCVGITFRVTRLGVAALCHPMLPHRPPHGATDTSLAGRRRYVDAAIRELAERFDALGALRGEVEVKVFGGADVLAVSHAPDARPTVGKLNCAAALDVLRAEGFNVSATRLGGQAGIHLRFDTRSGEVRLKALS